MEQHKITVIEKVKEPVVKIIKPGFPLCSLTFLVLLILKLTNNISIGWEWVFAPFWIPAAVIIAAIVVPIVLYFIFVVIGSVIAFIAEKLGRR